MLFKIGEFSRFSRITVRTLRYYDEIGLLKPVHIDSVSGYRYYSTEQLPRLNHIIMLKELGLSLDDIKDLVGNGIQAGHIKQLLQVKKAEIQARLDEDSRRLSRVQEWLAKINKDGLALIDPLIQIKNIPEVKVLSRRELGTYEEVLFRLADLLKKTLHQPVNQDRVTITGPVTMLCYDEEYKEKDADVEIAVPIQGEPAEPGPTMEVKILPGIRAICALHHGPYPDIDKVYSRIFRYVDENRIKLITPLRELYYNISTEAGEVNLLTEIQCPFREDDSPG